MSDRARNEQEDDETLSFAYRATRPGEYGVIEAQDSADVFVGVNRPRMELLAASGDEKEVAPDVEATVAAVMAELEPCVRALLKELARELVDDRCECGVIRLSLDAAAQTNWSAALQAEMKLLPDFVARPDADRSE